MRAVCECTSRLARADILILLVLVEDDGTYVRVLLEGLVVVPCRRLDAARVGFVLTPGIGAKVVVRSRGLLELVGDGLLAEVVLVVGGDVLQGRGGQGGGRWAVGGGPGGG